MDMTDKNFQLQLQEKCDFQIQFQKHNTESVEQVIFRTTGKSIQLVHSCQENMDIFYGKKLLP